MAVLEIIKQDNPILRKKSEPINEINEEIRKNIIDLKDTLNSTEGVGIAAVQVGILKRIIIVKYEEKEYVLINPKITMREGKIVDYEGCLSVQIDNYAYTYRKSRKSIFNRSRSIK